MLTCLRVENCTQSKSNNRNLLRYVILITRKIKMNNKRVLAYELAQAIDKSTLEEVSGGGGSQMSWPTSSPTLKLSANGGWDTIIDISVDF